MILVKKEKISIRIRAIRVRNTDTNSIYDNYMGS